MAVPTGGAQSVAPMGQISGLHVAFEGPNTSSCPSAYYVCYAITPGKLFKDQWCVVDTSTATGCSSHLAPGTWDWKLTSKGVIVVKTGKTTKTIKSTFKPTSGNPVYNDVKSKKSVGSTGGTPGYYFDFTACATSGKYKGDCIGLSSSEPYIPVGIIVQ